MRRYVIFWNGRVLQAVELAAMSSAAMTLPGDAQARRDIPSLCISTLANICEALAMYLPCAWQWLYSVVATDQHETADEPKVTVLAFTARSRERTRKARR